MKRKIFKVTWVIFFVILMVVNISVTSDNANLSFGILTMKAQPSPGNVTCYSTYDPCDFWCWEIYRCGSCASVSADDWQDVGTCNTSGGSGPGDPGETN